MSSSLLSSKYLNKLDVNRLQVNQLKANEVLPKIDSETKSYLYSLVLNNAQFEKVEIGDYNAELTISVSEQLQEVIQFTDRPFIQSSKISIQQFVQLFLLKGSDSFGVDPPNVVLSFNNTQKSYTMSLASELNDKVVFNLKLLEGEEHTQENFTGTINMFVDDDEKKTSNIIEIQILNQKVNFGVATIQVAVSVQMIFDYDIVNDQIFIYNGNYVGAKTVVPDGASLEIVNAESFSFSELTEQDEPYGTGLYTFKKDFTFNIQYTFNNEEFGQQLTSYISTSINKLL